MNRHIAIALAAGVLLFGSAGSFAEEQNPGKPMPPHMMQMQHQDGCCSTAAQYKSEAAQLREKAESHRRLAQTYRTRSPVKGSGSYENVAKHCDNLAKLYTDAAKEAEAMASELAKEQPKN